MQIDVELALVDTSMDELVNLQRDLPSEFYVEDRSDKGWGVVIRTRRKLSDDFNDAINGFLTPLNSLVELIISHKRILRVGVFYNTATCTMRLNSSDPLTAFKLPLEITVYPSSDEE